MPKFPNLGLINFLETIPNETLEQVLLDLTIQDIGHICNTYRRVAKFCRDDSFWRAYAQSRGIEKGNNEFWKQAVQESKVIYTHVDLTEMFSDLYSKIAGYRVQPKADIAYGIKDNKLIVVWYADVPFIPQEQEEFINKFNGSFGSMDFERYMRFVPQLTQINDKGTIRLTFEIFDRSRFDRYFKIQHLLQILLRARIPFDGKFGVPNSYA